MLKRRLRLHVSSLRSGNSSANLLQHDWNLFGEDQFEFLMCHRPAADLFGLEESLTLLADSLDDFGGFNKMLGMRVWSISSRIRNSEQKLIKRGKFVLLPSHSSNSRLTRSYLHTFCQGNTPLFQSKPLETNSIDVFAKRVLLKTYMAGFSRFMPALSSSSMAVFDRCAEPEVMIKK